MLTTSPASTITQFRKIFIVHVSFHRNQITHSLFNTRAFIIAKHKHILKTFFYFTSLSIVAHLLSNVTCVIVSATDTTSKVTNSMVHSILLRVKNSEIVSTQIDRVDQRTGLSFILPVRWLSQILNLNNILVTLMQDLTWTKTYQLIEGWRENEKNQICLIYNYLQIFRALPRFHYFWLLSKFY